MASRNLSIERILRRTAARLTSEAPAALPGFDAVAYMNCNADVAAHCMATPDPTAAATRHYLDHGIREMRRVFPDGAGLDDPGSRILPDHLRGGSGPHAHPQAEAWYAEAVALATKRGETVASLVASHPRAGWLQAGFNAPSYAARHADQFRTAMSREAVTLHFLEFGLETGETGYPGNWSPDLVVVLYGVDLSERLDGPQALRELNRLKGPGPKAMTEAELFALHGLTPALAGIFEADYSHAMSRKRASKAPPRPKIIEAFCKTGWQHMQPVHPDYAFDAEFYLETYGSDIDTSAGPTWQAALYKHWLSVGYACGHAPNLARLGSGLFDTDVPQAILDQLDRFALGSEGLTLESPPHQILTHMKDRPRPGLQWLDLSDRASQSFVRSLGDAKVIEGDRDTGQWLYALVLEANPDHVRASMAMADVWQHHGLAPLARVIRRKVPLARSTGWNALNLAELLQQQGHFDEAADVLAQAAPYLEHDRVQNHRRRDLGTSGFWSYWNGIADHAAAVGVERTRETLRAILRGLHPDLRHHVARRSDPIRRVALVGNEDLAQCKLYRVDQKADQLRAAGYEVQVFSPSHDLDQFLTSLDRFQAAIFFRVPAFPHITQAIISAGQAGVATFYEIDDIVFDTAHFPPSYESYANQITRRDYDAMACGVPLFERAMELCDYGIASTATLRELMADKVRSGQVFEHQNALGRLHMMAIESHKANPPVKDGPVVLFYGSGTKAHKEDFHDILEPALADLLRKHGRKIQIRLIGHFDTFTHLDIEKSNVRVMTPVWDVEEYFTLLAEADINLSVLAPSVLTDAKSEIKWMEAAMFGTPSVVSATRTHREKIVDGQTGFLCDGKEDFVKSLDRLIRDADLRQSIGAAARQTVLTDYSIEAMGQGLRDMFETIRLPGKAKKRIAVVNVFYPPQAVGGATRVVHDNVTLLKKKYGDDYEIDVICSLEGGNTPYAINRYARDGVRVWAISTPDRPDIDHVLNDKGMGQVFDRILDVIQPDLVHFHCIQRLTLAIVDATRLRQIPYVITMHDAWWISKNQFVLDNFGTASLYDYRHRSDQLPDRAKALNRALRGATEILSVSHAFAQVIERAGLPQPRVIENGVSALPSVTKVPSQNGRVRLAHIGGTSYHKGYHHVRNVLLTTEFDNLELLVIDHGLGPDVEIRETWGNTPVLRRGKVSQDEVDTLYAQIDVLLAPSTWPESYGLVTREALAAGAWVVASDRGSIGADVVPGENGFVVEVDTLDGVTGALKAIDAEPARYMASPEVNEELRPVEAQVDDLHDLYREIL
jgi:glycosyltransferase involved in cell wall biosynthesis